MIDYRAIFGYVPNITFTLEQHLKNYSEVEINARRLLESFHIIRDKMEVNLRPVIALFPHYSEHSHEHLIIPEGFEPSVRILRATVPGNVSQSK